MKLIDRDLLLSEIEKSREKNPHNDSKIRANHTIEHNHIAHLVLKQPIAYDVDNVVEQIECEYLMCRCKNNEVCAYPEKIGCCYDSGIKKAVDIVKSGGIE